MASSNQNAYQQLFAATLKAYPYKKKQKLQQQVNIYWQEIKENKSDLEEQLKRLNNIGMKNRSGLLNYWANIPKPVTTPIVVQQTDVSQVTPEISFTTLENSSSEIAKSSFNTPKQNEILNDISVVEKKIADFYIIKSMVGLSNDHERELQSLINSKISLEKKLKLLQVNQASKKRQRIQNKRTLSDLKNTYPEAAKKLKLNSK